MTSTEAIVFLAEGFEEIEAVTIIDILRRAEINTKIVSIDEKMVVNGAHDIKISADAAAQDMPQNAKILILPGGGVGTENLMNSAFVKRQITDFYNDGRWIAAVCAAPTVFAACGLLDGKTAVCYPSLEPQLKNAAIGKNNVEVCDKIITSKGPGTCAEFALKIVEVLKDKETADKLKEGMLF